jgi:hypothetical protein
MKITVVASFFTKGNMKINSGMIICGLKHHRNFVKCEEE